MSEITDKTWGMQTRSFGVIWLTEQEAQQAQHSIGQGAEYLEFGDAMIMKGDIAGFATGDRLRNVAREKKGDYQCKYGHWHSRGEQCAHHLESWKRR